MQAWMRTAHGLVHMVATDPQLYKAYPTLVADCHGKAASASESSYQTDKSTIEGAHSDFKMVVSGNPIALTASNPGR